MEREDWHYDNKGVVDGDAVNRDAMSAETDACIDSKVESVVQQIHYEYRLQDGMAGMTMAILDSRCCIGMRGLETEDWCVQA